MQENELSLAIIRTLPLGCAREELSYEWSHLKVSFERSGFRNFLGLVKCLRHFQVLYPSI